MNKEEALAICSDFRPEKTESGKVRCFFYTEACICKRPEYFRCELVLHKENEERKISKLTQISVSRINTILRCPRLYALNYVYQAEPPVAAKWKVVGRAFSDASAKIDLGMQYHLSEDINSMQVEKARLLAVLRRYQELRKDWGQIVVEMKVGFQYKDSYFLGFADRVTMDRSTIIEWKYASTKYDELKALRQAVVYFHGIPEAKKFVLAVADKPAHRLKDKETPYEFEERVYKELDKKKDELFTYTTYDRSFFDIPGTIEQLYQASGMVDAYRKANYPPVFNGNCDNCDFRPYCLKHLVSIGCNSNLCSHPTICRRILDVDNGVHKLPLEQKQLSKGE